MTLNGYIKLHRKIIEWGWYNDPFTKAVFIHLLVTANYTETNYKGIKLKPGQTIIGRKALAETLGMSEQNVRTALKHLKSTNEITTEVTNKFTVVTLVNWEYYQCADDEVTTTSTNELTNDQPTTNQQLTSNQPHLKNNKKDKKVISNNKIHIPPTLEEVTEYCEKRDNGIDPQRFIDYYETRGWMLGKVKMKDWRAAVRTWERNQKKEKETNEDSGDTVRLKSGAEVPAEGYAGYEEWFS